MKIDVEDIGSDAAGLRFRFDVGIGFGVIDLERLEEHDVHLLSRQLSLTRLKVNEADYFLKLTKRFLSNEAVTHYNFTAFVTALRSVLDVLTNEGKDKAGFREWRKAQELALMRHPDFSRFVDLRNKAVHHGTHPPKLAFGVMLREHHDGSRTAEPLVEILGLHGGEFMDPMEAMERALDATRVVVDEADRRGYLAPRRLRGHALSIRIMKERSPGDWVEAEPEELEMFGRKRPKFYFDESTEQTNP